MQLIKLCYLFLLVLFSISGDYVVLSNFGVCFTLMYIVGIVSDFSFTVIIAFVVWRSCVVKAVCVFCFFRLCCVLTLCR